MGRFFFSTTKWIVKTYTLGQVDLIYKKKELPCSFLGIFVYDKNMINLVFWAHVLLMFFLPGHFLHQGINKNLGGAILFSGVERFSDCVYEDVKPSQPLGQTKATNYISCLLFMYKVFIEEPVL